MRSSKSQLWKKGPNVPGAKNLTFKDTRRCFFCNPRRNHGPCFGRRLDNRHAGWERQPATLVRALAPLLAFSSSDCSTSVGCPERHFSLRDIILKNWTSNILVLRRRLRRHHHDEAEGIDTEGMGGRMCWWGGLRSRGRVLYMVIRSDAGERIQSIGLIDWCTILL